ncbi:condensation domain-containing protein, partial [Streptomyces sp. NPDC046985]|uniref:condensation domain-containing protein n=1 Tax=Streptomyces sp. NPDC046985 TaxID=3155377 RepID=UPI0033E3089B
MRVELGEIETVISTHPHVTDTTVLARDDLGTARRLVAYVVPREGDTLSSDDLLAHLRDRLPAHMVPSLVVVLDALPLNRNGKVDRARLPKPETPAPRGTERVGADWTAAQADIANEIERLLAVDVSSLTDDLFALGADSLDAARLVTRLRTRWHTSLSVRDVYESPTPEAIAKRLGALRDGPSTLPSSIPVDETAGPVTGQQLGLWFLQQVAPSNPAYNEAVALDLDGDLDPEALQSALARVVRLHPGLRTAFLDVDGRPVTRVVDLPDPVLTRHDVRDGTDGADGTDTAALDRVTADLVATPFDLAAPPLHRFALLRTGDRRHRLVMVFHHIVVDGWSVRLLLDQASRLYALETGARDVTPPAEPPLTMQQFAAWQQRQLDEGHLDGQLTHWRDRLSGATLPLQLFERDPEDANAEDTNTNAANATDPPAAHRIHFTLPNRVADALDVLARQHGGSMAMGLLAAWFLTLGRLSGRSDLSVGTPADIRDQPGTADLVGLLVNTVVLSVEIDPDTGFGDLLQQVRDVSLDAYANTGAPFHLVAREIDASTRGDAQSPIDVMFTYQNAASAPADLFSTASQAVPVDRTPARFPVTLFTRRQPDGTIDCTLETDPRHYSSRRTGTIHQTLVRVLDAVTGDPQIRPDRLRLQTAADSALVRDWNATSVDFPDVCLHELFEARVAVCPDAVAVV